MKKTISYLSVLSLLFLSACFLDEDNNVNDFLRNNIADIEQYLIDNNINAQETESGLYYTITEENPDGQALVVGEQVTIHYTGKLLSGTVFDSSSVFLNRPQRMLLDVGFLFEDPEFFPNQSRLLAPGLNEGLKLLKTGEKATFIMPNTLGFGSASNTIIPPYSVLIYEVEVISTKNEDTMIEEYITDNSLTVTATGTGLRYTEDNSVSGDPADDADVITLKYTGKFLDGFVFDSSNEFTYTVDSESSFVEGWKEAMTLLPVGYQGEIIFPSALGYGGNGQVGSGGRFDIPPYAPLIFEVEVLNIEKK